MDSISFLEDTKFTATYDIDGTNKLVFKDLTSNSTIDLIKETQAYKFEPKVDGTDTWRTVDKANITTNDDLNAIWEELKTQGTIISKADLKTIIDTNDVKVFDVSASSETIYTWIS